MTKYQVPKSIMEIVEDYKKYNKIQIINFIMRDAKVN